MRIDSPFRRFFRVTGMVSIVCWSYAAPAAAQRLPSTVFAVDADVIGGSVSYAWDGADGTYWGVGAGLGGTVLGYMVFAGGHFAEGVSYSDRDTARDKFLFELAHIEGFRRWSPTVRADYDVGVRTSLFFHSDSSDDDFGGGVFVGAYTKAMWGWPRLKFGPGVLIGLFTEGRRTREFGVFVSPLSGRVSFGW